MRANKLDSIIDKFLFEEVKKTILKESEDKKEVYHVTCEGKPVVICSSMDEAQEHIDKLKKDHPGKQFIIEKSEYESHEDMIDKLDEMGEELDKTENQDMKNTQSMNEKLVGNQSKIDANKNGKIDAQDFKMLKGKKKDIEEEEEECHECGDKGEYMEEEMCSECGSPMNEEGMCSECWGKGMEESEDDEVHDDWDNDNEGEDYISQLGKIGVHRKEKGEDDDYIVDYSMGNQDDPNMMPAPPTEINLDIDDEPKKEFMTGVDLGKSFNKLKHGLSEEMTCNECGSNALMEGECLDCGHMHESVKKTQKLRITESELVSLISKMVSEAKNKEIKKSSVPGLTVTKKAQSGSDKENKANIKDVEAKIKKRESFGGTDNPEFPKPIGKGEKKAINNTDDENEYVEDNRGGGLQDLRYENEPSQMFKDRLKMALDGHTKMGNSQDAANVVKSNLGKDIKKTVERKEKKRKEAPMYKKDAQPVKIVKESTNKLSNILEEEIKKMKNLSNYNKKTQ